MLLIELKIIGNDPYDLLDMLKIFWNLFKVIKESQTGQRSNFQKCSDWAEIKKKNNPYDILRIVIKILKIIRGH